MIIDTHMHIFDEKYQGIQENVIKESLELGVNLMIAVGYDKQSSLKAIELSKKYDFIYASIGLHPSEVQKEEDLELSWLEDLLKTEKIVAIGEIGLDYYWDKTYKELQKKYFIKQIELSKKYNLPIIVHCRDAISDCYQILKDNIVPGVMHCYSSSLEMAKLFTKLGYYIGVGGVVTFKNSKEIKDVVREIGVEYLLSETDSPYLTPTPYRGKINIPGYTKYVVDEIANIKEMDLEIVKKTLVDNAKKLFNISI